MKKTFFSLCLALASIALYAQQPQAPEGAEGKLTPEQKAQRQADKLASEILLSDATAAQFVPLYKAYLMEVNAINDKYRPAKRSDEMKDKPLTDKEVKARIEANFAKSQAILDARKAYYQKYLKILTPKQIMMVYDLEKMRAERAAYRYYGKQHGAPQEGKAPKANPQAAPAPVPAPAPAAE